MSQSIISYLNENALNCILVTLFEITLQKTFFLNTEMNEFLLWKLSEQSNKTTSAAVATLMLVMTMYIFSMCHCMNKAVSLCCAR